MGFEVKPAERKRVLARVSFIGPSGGGKTMSSLRFGRGLVGHKGQIILIDTEEGSSHMYAGQAGGFSVIEFGQPYTIERYIEALDAAEGAFEASLPADQRLVIVDQASYAWSGEGGLLHFVDSQTTSRGGKEGFAAWKKGTPLQNRFIQRLLATRAHLFVNMRQKVEWVLEKNEKGFTEPKKVGLAPIQRPGFEYEMQLEFALDQDTHKARATKDRTSLFDGRIFIPSEAEGKQLRDFLASGAGVLQDPPPAPAAPVEVISAAQLGELISAAKSGGVTKKEDFLALVKDETGLEHPSKMTVPQFEALLGKFAGLAVVIQERRASHLGR